MRIRMRLRLWQKSHLLFIILLLHLLLHLLLGVAWGAVGHPQSLPLSCSAHARSERLRAHTHTVNESIKSTSGCYCRNVQQLNLPACLSGYLQLYLSSSSSWAACLQAKQTCAPSAGAPSVSPAQQRPTQPPPPAPPAPAARYSPTTHPPTQPQVLVSATG